MTARGARLCGAGIVLAGLLVVLCGFLTWAVVALTGASSSSLGGWGAISGGPDSADGDNLNDVITSLGGVGSYRPALLPTTLAGPGVVAGIWVAVRRSRFAAAGAVAVGMAVAAWGLFRGVRTGDIAGLLTDGDIATASIGPWATLAGGLLMVAAAVPVCLVRPAAAPTVPRSRGIQPRR